MGDSYCIGFSGIVEYRKYKGFRHFYYNHTNLINLTKEAYPDRNYTEVADEYAAATGGYALYQQDITERKYLEYDHLVDN